MKSTLLAISLICGISTHLLAADDSNSSSSSSGRTRQREVSQQDQDYAKSLFTDMVIKDGKSFQDYMKACSDSQVKPFVPSGLFTSQTVVLTNDDFDNELNKEYQRLQVSDNAFAIFPSCAPKEILHLFNEQLLPKYGGFLHQKYQKKSKLNVSKERREEIQKDLAAYSTDDLHAISDPINMIIILKMFDFCPTLKSPSNIPLDPWTVQNFKNTNFKEDKPVIFLLGGIKKKKFLVNAEAFHKNLRGALEGLWLHNLPNQMTAEAMKPAIIKETMDHLNQVFTVCGKPYFDLNKDARVVDGLLTKWFTIAHYLVNAEIKEWEEREPIIKAYYKKHKWVMNALNQAEHNKNTYYSGVNKSSFDIGLVQTPNKDKAEGIQGLRNIVDAHYQEHKAAVEEYKAFKQMKAILKKTQEWLDEIFGAVAKHGRFS